MKRISQVFIFSVVFFVTGCSIVPPFIFIPRKPPPAPPAPPPRVTLVLGSGGTKALTNVGVLKVLEANHIPVDMIVATNSGSIVGVMYADNPNSYFLQNRLMQVNPAFLIDPSALHILESEVTGAQLQNFIYHQIRAKQFRDLKIRFVAVATDLRNGRNVILQSGPIAPAINAAAALPPYIRPVRMYGHVLIDGNTTNPIPVDVARTFNPKVIIAVKPTHVLPPGLPTNIFAIYDRTFAISDNIFNKLSSRDASVVIKPRLSFDSALNPAQKRAYIYMGEVAAQKALPQICELLQKNGIESDCSHAKKQSKQWPKRIMQILTLHWNNNNH